MAENDGKRKRSTTNSVEPPKRKIMRVDDPSFEVEINFMLLASEQSDREGDFEDCILSENDLLQHHESDQEDSSEKDQVFSESVCSDNSENEDNVPLPEFLLR
ncbi:hypothetical protein HHI36_024340 [Cryptolaemus montrouzieri]|uniref:Uncharacterized protein n=1 Tax=Cryptolaemus montrouzieri TaxID=559131 RepID=A0ABD2N7H0_9CUCU